MQAALGADRGHLPGRRLLGPLIEAWDLALIGEGDVFMLAGILVYIARLWTAIFPYRRRVSEDTVILDDAYGVEEVQVVEELRRSLP